MRGDLPLGDPGSGAAELQVQAGDVRHAGSIAQRCPIVKRNVASFGSIPITIGDVTYRKRDKPPFASWLTSEREGHGLKAEEVARRLREAGLQAEYSTYRTWEATSGRRPAPETVEALERMFGSRAPDDDEAASDLAAAINRLVDRLDVFLSPEWMASRVAEAVELELARRGATERAGTGSPSDVRQTSSPGQ